MDLKHPEVYLIPSVPVRPGLIFDQTEQNPYLTIYNEVDDPDTEAMHESPLEEDSCYAFQCCGNVLAIITCGCSTGCNLNSVLEFLFCCCE